MIRENKGIFLLVAILMIAAVLLCCASPAKAAPVEEEIFREEVNLTTDPVTLCNLTAEEYDGLLEGTELEGLGRQLAAGEKLYKVNGLFIAAIIAHESGWGTSYSARVRNNLGGIKGGSGYRSFYNKEICVLYMFSLLDRLYISKGRDTIGEIGAMYYETGGWEASVTSIMNGFIERG